MVRRSQVLAGLVALPLIGAAAYPAGAETAPTIAKVRLLQKQGGVTAKIFGSHFGKSPVKLPCNGCEITEMQLFYFSTSPTDNEDPQKVNITQWNDAYIELRDLKGAPGSTAVFAIKNDSLGKAGKTVADIATLPGGPPGPVIRRLTFRRNGKHLKIIVDGRGFGQAPPDVPGSIDTEYFEFWVWVTGGNIHNYPWAAGHNGNSVTLNYDSWTDSRIVISGFGAQYHGGSEDWVARPGDAVVATLYNNPGGGAFGQTTGKASRIQW